MIIECNAISQNINELLIAFQDCNKIKNNLAILQIIAVTCML